TFAKKELVAYGSVAEALVNRLADHDLALSAVEPSALNQINVGTQFKSYRRHSAHSDIGFASVVLAGNHDDDHVFAGHQGLTGLVFGDSRQVPNCSVCLAIDATLQLRLRALAQHQHVQRITAADKRLLQSGQQSHDKDSDGNGERDSQSGHHSRAQAE